MIVSSIKVKEVRAALERFCDGGDIVLRGPCGSGKSTALEQACRDLGYRIMRYNGVNGKIVDFVGSCLRLAASGAQKIIVFCPGADSLEYYCLNVQELSRVPLCKVFSVQEGSIVCYRAQQILLHASFISFNAFSETALNKALLGSVELSRAAEAQDIIRSCAGDLRQALNQLHAAGIQTEGNENCLPSVRKRKSPGDLLKQSSDFDTKDSMFSFYHILGKILYNKAGTIGTVEKLIEDPVIATAGFSPIDWIQENVIDFVPDVESLVTIFETVCFVDSWRYRADELTDTAVSVVFSTCCVRSSENGMGVKRSFKPFRKPGGYTCTNKALETRTRIVATFTKEGSCRIDPMLIHMRLQASGPMCENQNVIFPTDLESDPIEECYFGMNESHTVEML